VKRYRHALVLGCGASGEAAARLLVREGSRVTVLDAASGGRVAGRADALASEGVGVVTGATTVPVEDFDVCVVSPGLSAEAPWVREVRGRGVDILPEIELGWSRRGCPVVAVTGTNGKSTAVKWIAEALGKAGLRSVAAGNYGLPASQAVLDHPDAQWLVLEISSFQLETVVDFRPEVGLLLNLQPNHLDRHGTLDAYERAKARLFANAASGDACVVHEPVAGRIRALCPGRGEWHTFGASAAAEYVYRGGRVRRRGAEIADLTGTRFANDVLGGNAAGVLAALEACGIPPGAALEAARAFVPLPHRMQEIRRLRGVRFVDDSKATTLAAMQAGVRMSEGPVRLIAGGLLKERDVDSVKDLLALRARAVYLIGSSEQAMAEAWSTAVPCRRCGVLKEAVAEAWRDAMPGETILLSPGCASFDQFRGFEERGEHFAEIVNNIAEE
jgi:UDP-N-acetylmuramoylalanine--D-glutamate ligase